MPVCSDPKRILAINKYEDDYPFAIVEIPDDMNEDEAFIAWYQKQPWGAKYKNPQDILMNENFCWKELKLEHLE